MALREILAKFDIDTSGLSKGAKEGDSKVDGLTKTIKKLGTALGGYAIGRGIKDMVTDLVEQGSALNDASGQLGINAGALQRWQFAAKLNGVAAEGMTTAIRFLQKNVADASDSAGGPAAKAFRELGVSVKDAAGKTKGTETLLQETGLAIAGVADETKRTQLSMALFGRAGAALKPLFADGAEGLKQYLGEVDRLGGGITDDAISGLDDLGDNMDRFELATTSAKVQIIKAFLPAMTSIVEKLTQQVAAVAKDKNAMETLKGAVVALGVAGAAAAVTFIAPWLPAITGFAVLGLLVQDFIVGLKGGDSEIGHIIDELFGQGAGKTFFSDAAKDAKELVEDIKQVIEGIKQLKGGKLKDDIVSQSKTEAAHREQSQAAGAGGGYLTTNDKAMRGYLTEDDIRIIGQIKEAISSREREASGGVFRLPESIPTEDAEKVLDKLHQQGIDNAHATQDAIDKAVAPQVESGLSSISKFFNLPPVVPGGGESKPTQVTQTNSTSITIQAPSGDASDIADATKGAVGTANRANYEGIRRAVTP